MQSRVGELVGGVAELPAEKQMQFARLWVWRLKEDSRGDLIERVLRTFGRYAHVRGRDSKSVESWMEARLVKDFSVNPRRLAYEYRFYKQTSREMEPYLYAVAKRVKKRLAARETRKGRLARWPKPPARRVAGKVPNKVSPGEESDG